MADRICGKAFFSTQNINNNNKYDGRQFDSCYVCYYKITSKMNYPMCVFCGKKHELNPQPIVPLSVLKDTKYKCRYVVFIFEALIKILLLYSFSVSSVWNRDVKQHGRAFLFDDQEDTAWSSEPVTKRDLSIDRL